MLFNSVEFLLIFLPLVLAGFYVILKYNSNLTQWFLIFASMAFYSYWDIRYLPLLAGSIGVNYLFGNYLIRKPSRKLLVTSIVFNLGLLVFFKYTDFIIETVNTLQNQQFDLMHIALPLAISFFTFQQIAYLVDCYSQKIEKEYGFSNYALFVCYFPQLIAGPIVHHKEMVPQFQKIGSGYHVDAETVSKGLILLLVGLFKKVVIADYIALYVDPAFSNVASLSFYDAWSAMLGFTLELYFDFSAYCEIAMGLGLLFGIKLPINFQSPYKATSIQDFWRRWHITLGEFLKHYLYIPLGGSNIGAVHTVLALSITMLVGGLWHGASWHYVVWGLLHGLMLSIYFIWRQTSYQLPPAAARLITFICVMLAWVMFRADSFNDAIHYYGTLFGLNGVTLPPLYQGLAENTGLINVTISPYFSGHELWLLIVLAGCTMYCQNIHEVLATIKPNNKLAATMATLVAVIALNLGTKSTFLYFQF